MDASTCLNIPSLDYCLGFSDQAFVAGIKQYFSYVRVHTIVVSALVLIPTLFYELRIRKSTTARVEHVFFDFFYPILDQLILNYWLLGTMLLGLSYLTDKLAPSLKLGLLDGASPLVLGIVYMGAMDLARTLSHYSLHKIPLLWNFHAVHHSQVELNPMTSWRIHFFETVWNKLFMVGFFFILGGEVIVFYWYSVFNNLIGYLLHSNLTLKIGFLDRVFVTPQYHRLHHSSAASHFDKNFAERFVVFDWLLGTTCYDYRGVKEYGVPGFKTVAGYPTWRSMFADWFRLNFDPFRDFFRAFRLKHPKDRKNAPAPQTPEPARELIAPPSALAPINSTDK